MDSPKPGIDRMLGIRPINDPSRIPERIRRQIGIAITWLAGLFFGPFASWCIRQAIPKLDPNTVALYWFGGLVVGIVTIWLGKRVASIPRPRRIFLSVGLFGLYLFVLAYALFVTPDATHDAAKAKWKLAKNAIPAQRPEPPRGPWFADGYGELISQEKNALKELRETPTVHRDLALYLAIFGAFNLAIGIIGSLGLAIRSWKNARAPQEQPLRTKTEEEPILAVLVEKHDDQTTPPILAAIEKCPHCGINVIFKKDGECPSCRYRKSAAMPRNVFT